MNLIKKRMAKNSERGLYIQDKELRQTLFAPGETYKYIIDVKTKKIVILPSDDGKGNKVSKRLMKDGLKSVIDIRNKEVVEMFGEAEFLQVSIFSDQVVVETFEANRSNGAIDKVVESIKNKVTKRKKIVSIKDFMNVKKKSSFVFSKKALEKVAGGYQQISFEELGWSVSDEATESRGSIRHIDSALANIHIPLQVASLFSGSGILDLGFKESGYDLAFALELSPEACETYRHNLGGHIFNADITKFDMSKIAKAPVMIGGSPCQGFSAANRKSNFLDNPNNMLVKKYIEAVKANENCQVFVLENVPQILTAGNGKFKEEIYEALSEFEITSGILTATDFGSAQMRKRAIFIGSKIGKIDLPKPFLNPSEYKTVKQAFEGLGDDVPNQTDYSVPRSDTVARMEAIPAGGNWKDIPDDLKTDKMKEGVGPQSSVYRRLDWNKPSITIVNPRKSNITHPTLNRSLSIRECARLFGVKDDFVFKGKLNSMQQQICNAVPVELAKAVAESVKKAISQFNIRNRNVVAL